ncbi:MAG: DNA lyase [Desulfatitalea sp.]|nr:pyrimidine dimer DNA glycosylase/endonuclease V [Desulfatitalea sp.]NNK00513.1 DNA lyase [Desulfatitalea sp.]
MRLWSLHPKYLDAKGLVALWREGLLAQRVLAGNTIGYRNHPQLERFKKTVNPLGAIATYLRFVVNESETRGYRFDKSKINNGKWRGKIRVTSGQLDYEFKHLLKKIEQRDPKRFADQKGIQAVEPHPMFSKTQGGTAPWEIIPPM